MKKISLVIFFSPLVCGGVFAATAADYYNAGMVSYKQNKPRASVSYFKAALDLNPNDWQSYEGMGRAYYSLRQYGESYDACVKSLDINPDNPSLQELVHKLIPIVIVPPPAPTGKTARSSSSGREEGPPLAPHFWIKGSLKVDYSLEEDFNKGTSGWNVASQQAGATKQKATAGNWGVGSKLEFGNALDSENAMTFALFTFALDGFTGDASNASASIHEKLSPLILGLEVDFCRFWPSDKSRFYLKGGIGYYYALVNFTQTIQGTFGSYSPEIGTVGNGDFGVNLGAGYELKVDKDLGVELSGEVRYAAISEIVGASGGGIVPGLAVLPEGYIGVVDTKTIGGNGGRFAVIDLTGIEVELGLVHYFF